MQAEKKRTESYLKGKKPPKNRTVFVHKWPYCIDGKSERNFKVLEIISEFSKANIKLSIVFLYLSNKQ